MLCRTGVRCHWSMLDRFHGYSVEHSAIAGLRLIERQRLRESLMHSGSSRRVPMKLRQQNLDLVETSVDVLSVVMGVAGILLVMGVFMGP